MVEKKMKRIANSDGRTDGLAGVTDWRTDQRTEGGPNMFYDV